MLSGSSVGFWAKNDLEAVPSPAEVPKPRLLLLLGNSALLPLALYLSAVSVDFLAATLKASPSSSSSSSVSMLSGSSVGFWAKNDLEAVPSPAEVPEPRLPLLF
eukprot:Skav232417  [mRNA]  locus=scaffold189:14484:15866:- [translate_table: standard]